MNSQVSLKVCERYIDVSFIAIRELLMSASCQLQGFRVVFSRRYCIRSMGRVILARQKSERGGISHHRRNGTFLCDGSQISGFLLKVKESRLWTSKHQCVVFFTVNIYQEMRFHVAFFLKGTSGSVQTKNIKAHFHNNVQLIAIMHDYIHSWQCL